MRNLFKVVPIAIGIVGLARLRHSGQAVGWVKFRKYPTDDLEPSDEIYSFRYVCCSWRTYEDFI